MNSASRGARVALALGTLGLAVGLPAAAASAATAHHQSPKLSDLQKGLRYYKGKTITFVAPDKPGGGFDQFARLVAPGIAAYLHATVIVSNIPAGNTVAGQNAVAKAAPDGLTVGWLNAGPDIENEILNLPALNFNPLREAFLGATAPGQTAIVTLNSPACSQWSSFANVVNNSSPSNKVVEVLQTSGTGTFFQLMVNAAFGIQFRPVTGYASTSDQVQGFARGDGCLSEMPASVADSLVTGGKAKAIALSVPLQKNSAILHDYAGVPSIAQLATQLKSHIKTAAQRNAYAALTQVAASTRVFFTASAVKAPQVAALRAAFQWTMNNKAIQAKTIAEGNPIGQESGPFAKQQYQQFYNAAKKEVPVLRSVIG